MADPENKTIIDNTDISKLVFTYLVAYRASVLIYRSGQQIYVEFYRPANFSVYNQQLPRIIDLQLFVNVSLAKVSINWQECMHNQTNSILEVPHHFCWGMWVSIK